MIRVVIADDQAVVRTGLRTIFELTDDLSVVGEASDGRQALAAVAETDPDVVLMDLRMPVLDGIQATRTLVAQGARCRVCVLTTYGEEETVHDALTAGALGFVVKSDPPEQIVAAVRTVAAGEWALGRETTAVVAHRFLQGYRPVASADGPITPLTEREAEVLRLVAAGLSNAEIAQRLFITEGTVKTHVARILPKLGVRDRVQAAVFAHRHGLA